FYLSRVRCAQCPPPLPYTTLFRSLHPTNGVVRVLGERLGRTDLAELRTRIGFATMTLAERIPPDETVHDVVVTASWSVVGRFRRSEEHTSELQSRENLVCRRLLEK